MDKGRLLRRMLRFTGRIPNKSRLLYPVWLAAQLSEVLEQKAFDRLPAGFDGLRLAYASDIHFGPLLDEQRLIAFAQRLQALNADLILLGGDYGEDTDSAIACFENMPALSAPEGVYAVIGNHDHMGSPEAFDRLLAGMRDKGIQPLLNAAQLIHRGEDSLCLCAVDDIKQSRPDFAPIKESAARSDFVIFAPHSPDVFPLAFEEPGFRFDLGLAGHTHGGQLVLFGSSLHSSSRYGDRYRAGWYEEQGSQLMVSQGVGCSLLPIRIGTRAQIHLLTLRHKA